jgi:hypothetical protein
MSIYISILERERVCEKKDLKKYIKSLLIETHKKRKYMLKIEKRNSKISSK